MLSTEPLLVSHQSNTDLYSIQHFGRENVHSSVDFIGDKLYWFFYKTLNSTVFCVVHNDTVFRWFLDTRHL